MANDGHFVDLEEDILFSVGPKVKSIVCNEPHTIANRCGKTMYQSKSSAISTT